MAAKPYSALAEHELVAHIEALLADPAHADNPLKAPLAALFASHAAQQERLERLVRISDGYHLLTRNRSVSLAEQYDRQLRRLEKLARISDRYQNSLRELSEALKDAALRDPLTGLGNRRFLMERIKEENERANRKATPYALVILDVDHFKRINDRFGHEAGDTALSRIAQTLQETLREYDLCGRWGGEEFLILMPETPLTAAEQVAERVRQHIADLDFPFFAHRTPHITVSLGLAQHQLGETYSDTLNRADCALLAAKSAGRNRSISA
ncbi:MAG: biofilm regulation diguanylate cyclase SiaD [Azovibrio sp.]|nr:biofilm regulation diguanylate cyclase SiaD [Azovibrio sp.]